MSNSKVSALSAKATPVTADTIYLIDSADGTSKKCTLLAMFASATPTLTTPVLGVATATTINKVTITQPAASATLTIANTGSLITSGAFAITLTATAGTGVTLPITGTLATLAGSETLSGKTLTAPVLVSGGYIADANGNEGIILVTTGSAVNEVTITNAATLGAPQIAATGETNVSLDVSSKGTGSVTIWSGAKAREVAIFADTASAVNEITFRAAATGAFPKIESSGEADTGITFQNSEAEEGLIIDYIASAVNEVTISNAAAGNNASMIASGTGTSPGINIAGKAGASATNPGGTMVLVGGAGNTTGAGGAASLTAGAGGNDAVGGAVSLTGGAAGGGNRAGGQADVTGGLGKGTAAGGAVVLTSGAASNGTGVNPGASGAITLQVGAAGTATTGTAGAGGAISILGVAGGASTGASSTAGAGSSISLTAGTGGASSGGSDVAGAGGSIVLTPGEGGAGATAGLTGHTFVRGSLLCRVQGAPTAKTVSATLTAAEVISSIITVNQGAAGSSALQLPTGTALQNALSASFGTNDSFDVSLINTSTVDAEDAAFTVNTGVTIVGDANVSANNAVTARSSGLFRFRKTGDNVFVCYRLA